MIEITEEPNEDRMSAEELATQQEDFARQLYAHAEGVETGLPGRGQDREDVEPHPAHTVVDQGGRAGYSATDRRP